MTSNIPKRPLTATSEADGLPPPKKPFPPPTSNSTIDLQKTIYLLPTEAKNQLLLQAAQDFPSLIDKIEEAAQAARAAELARPPETFEDETSEACDLLVEETHKSRYSSGPLGPKTDDIEGDIDKIGDVILRKAGPQTRYETRRNAIDAFAEIFECVMGDACEVIARETFDGGAAIMSRLVSGMLVVAKGMDGEERERMKGEKVLVRLKELLEESDREELDDVLAIFGVKMEERGEENEEEG